MKAFQIAEIAGLCGINAHTLRMWENRYNLLTPSRIKGNYRSYSLTDVEYLLKISLLNKQRFRISELARMHADEIETHLKDLNADEERFYRSADRLIVSMFAMNIEEFELVLDSAVIHWGVQKTIEKIIIPFIERTKLFTCKNCRVEVDLAIVALRKKLILGIEKINPRQYTSKTLLLFLPLEEYFDLLLLYSCYLAKLHGFGVVYMGPNVSFAKVRNIADLKKPHRLIAYASDAKKFKTQSAALDYNVTLISSEHGVEYEYPSNVKPLHFSYLEAMLSSI